MTLNYVVNNYNEINLQYAVQQFLPIWGGKGWVGMYYYSARYYAPPTFISRDPMFEKYPSISPYTYCANNPVGYIDPDGETIRNPLRKVLTNRTLMNKLAEFDKSVSEISGLDRSSYTFIVTDGDRYKKNDIIYSSSTNNQIKKSAEKSRHLREYGAIAIDLSIPDNIPYEVLQEAAKNVGLRIDPAGKYSDKHFHLDLGLNVKTDKMQYEEDDYMPTDSDFLGLPEYKQSYLNPLPDPKLSEKLKERKTPITDLLGGLLDLIGF